MIWSILTLLVTLLRGRRTEARDTSALPEPPVAAASADPLAPSRSLAMVLGSTPDTASRDLIFTEQQWSRHGIIIGCTGSGKTYLAIAMCQDLIRTQRGFAYIDPKGDAIEDLLAFISRRCDETGSDALLRRVHLLELRVDRVFTCDPFAYEPDPGLPENMQRTARLAWLQKEADSIVELAFRAMHETDEGKPRLKRILRSVLIAVGTAVDDSNQHLPLADALVLLDVKHPRHDEVYDCVKFHLPSDVRGDFELIRAMKSAAERFAQTEGAINRLRALLSGLLKTVFTVSARGVNFRDIVLKRQILLVNVAETRYVSKAQNEALGALVIHEIAEAVGTIPRRERVPFKLIIDECERYMNEDVQRLLKMGRGWLCSVTNMTQNLSAFEQGDINYLDTSLNEPGFVACFQQKIIHPKLSQLLFYPNIDYTHHVIDRDRPDGYDLLITPSVTTSETVTQSRQRGGNVTRKIGITSQHSLALKNELSAGNSESRTVSVAHTLQDAESQKFEHSMGHNVGFAEADSAEMGQNRSRSREHGATWGRDESHSEKENIGFSSQHTHTAGNAIADTTQETTGSSSTDQQTNAFSDANQVSRGDDWTSRGPGEYSFSTSNGRQSVDTHSGSSSNATSENESRTAGTTETESESDAHTKGVTKGCEVGRANTVRRGGSNATSNSVGHSLKMGQAATKSTGRQWGVKDGFLTQHTEGVQEGEAQATSKSQGRTQGTITATATSHERGQAEGQSWNSGRAIADGVSNGLSVTPVSRTRVVREVQPQLAKAVDEQFHEFHTELSTLDCAQAFVRVQGIPRTLRLRVRHVAPAYNNPDEFFAAIDRVKAKLAILHDYNIVPDLSLRAERKRIDQFVAASPRQTCQTVSTISLPTPPGNPDAPFG